MTFQQLCSEIAKREGGKKQIGVGQVREVIKIITEIGPDALAVLERLSKKRKKK